jgi:hypothetical protein
MTGATRGDEPLPWVETASRGAESPGSAVLLSQIQAGGTELNMHAASVWS